MIFRCCFLFLFLFCRCFALSEWLCHSCLPLCKVSLLVSASLRMSVCRRVLSTRRGNFGLPMWLSVHTKVSLEEQDGCPSWQWAAHPCILPDLHPKGTTLVALRKPQWKDGGAAAAVVTLGSIRAHFWQCNWQRNGSLKFVPGKRWPKVLQRLISPLCWFTLCSARGWMSPLLPHNYQDS